MKRLSVDITIKSTPEAVWDFITTLNHDDKFFRWHPDHIKLKIIKGNLHTPGSLIYFEEHLGKKRLRFICQIKRIVEYESMELEVPFTFSRFLPAKGGCKIIRSKKNAVDFSIHVDYGYSIYPFSLFTDWFTEKFIVGHEDIRQHTKEEMEILKEILEEKTLNSS